MQLHVSVRNVLKRATQLALCSGSASVTSEHLLQCNPDQEWTEPEEIRTRWAEGF